VADAGVTLPLVAGRDITPQTGSSSTAATNAPTYEHGNAPYLSRDFFHRMAATMPEALAAVCRRARWPANCYKFDSYSRISDKV
jgi:predicted N-acyltransferase